MNFYIASCMTSYVTLYRAFCMNSYWPYIWHLPIPLIVYICHGVLSLKTQPIITPNPKPNPLRGVSWWRWIEWNHLSSLLVDDFIKTRHQRTAHQHRAYLTTLSNTHIRVLLTVTSFQSYLPRHLSFSHFQKQSRLTFPAASFHNGGPWIYVNQHVTSNGGTSFWNVSYIGERLKAKGWYLPKT